MAWRRRASQLSGSGKFWPYRHELPPETVYAQTLYQIGALAAITRARSGVMHVKPHGMLYNQAAKDPPLADAIAKAVHACDPSLILVGLAGSELIRAGQHYGWSRVRRSLPIGVIRPTAAWCRVVSRAH
jgi:lactam utilization protein B